MNVSSFRTGVQIKRSVIQDVRSVDWLIGTDAMLIRGLLILTTERMWTFRNAGNCFPIDAL